MSGFYTIEQKEIEQCQSQHGYDIIDFFIILNTRTFKNSGKPPSIILSYGSVLEKPFPAYTTSHVLCNAGEGSPVSFDGRYVLLSGFYLWTSYN